MRLKYAVHNVCHRRGKTAASMPKPIVGDNGSGYRDVHQSIWKNGENLFAGEGYAGLSELAPFYIGGIIKHAKALNAITNPGTNSYTSDGSALRPRSISRSARNRSGCDSRTVGQQRQAAPRIEVASRIRRRMPTSHSRPTTTAGAGWRSEQNPPGGNPIDKNLYELEAAEARDVAHPCASLDEASRPEQGSRGSWTRAASSATT